MTRLKPSSKISSLLNNISHSFHLSFLYLLCFLFIFNIASFGVKAQDQQTDSDGTIAIPFMEWINLKPKLAGTPPPGLKGFAFGYSKDSNLVVIFGGTTPSGSKSGATYIIDFNDNSWKIPSDYGLSSPQTPEARSNMIFGVDKSSSYRNAFIISCGEGSGNLLYNDVWAFDFNYKQWTKVDNVTGENPPPLMYDSFGGIDTTLATSSQIVQANTLWTSHGRNGTHFFTDLYALFIDGTLSSNIKTLSAIWYKFPVENIKGEIPSGRTSVAGTILPNNRLAMYGGCDKLEENCVTSDSYSLNLGSNYVNGKVDTAEPSWSKKNSCLGARFGAAMTMNSNPLMAFSSQAIVYGGSSQDLKAVGPPGEIGVLNADLGTWVRVLPQKDPDYGYPPQRVGAQMIPIPLAIGAPLAFPATSILLFGGQSLDENNNLNDLWILQLYNNSTSGNAANSNPQVTSMEFQKCVPESKQTPNSTEPAKQPVPPGADAGNSKSNSDGSNIIISKSHVNFSIISFAFLPLAASVIRFGYGSNKKWAIAGLYTMFIVVSYATAFYGFVIGFQDKQKLLSGHFNTDHGLFGLILLVLLYIFVPLMAVISLCVSKKYESDLISNDDLDNDKGGIGSKLGFFNWRNSESNSKPIKSFEVSRPGNRLVSGGEIPPQLPPTSVLKSSDNWMEKRKSVTIVENHPTMSSQGSRNNSLQNGPRTSQSTAVSRSGLQTTTPLSNHSSSAVRRTHHIIAQLVLLLTTIYIGHKIVTTPSVDLLYFYIFIGFMAIIYLIWIIAAWYGYPKGRNSLLVLFMHKIACGKGETNETKQYDFDENSESGAIPTPSSNRMRSVRIDDDEMDEEAEQAQLEQDMHNREVVVMTIPKRRLTVVNA